MDTWAPDDALAVPEWSAGFSPESSPGKGKRQAEGDVDDLEGLVEVEENSEGKSKRMKRTERPRVEPKPRPVRERRQSSYSLSRGFLDDKYFDSLEKHNSKQEARRAAFYDTQSYVGEVLSILPLTKMATQERDAFPHCHPKTKLMHLYLFHRNSILALAASVEPSFLAFSQYEEHLNATGHQYVAREVHLVQRIWKFLHVNRRINKEHKLLETFENESPDDSENDFPDPGLVGVHFEKLHSSWPHGDHTPLMTTKKSPKATHRPKTASSSTTAPSSAVDQSSTHLSASSTPTQVPSRGPGSFVPLHSSNAVTLRVVKNGEKSGKQTPEPLIGAPLDPSSAPIEPFSTFSPQFTEFSQISPSLAVSSPRAEMNTSMTPKSAPRRSKASSSQKVSSKKSTPRPRSTRSKREDGDLLPPLLHDGPLLNPRSTPQTASSLRVCVIGAGIAGLAAAQLLHQHGIENVVVFESRLRIGGRVHSINIDGHMVELGAQFIQDDVANPVLDMCSQLSLRLQSLTKENSGSALLDLFSERRDPLSRDLNPEMEVQDEKTLMTETENHMDVSEPSTTNDQPHPTLGSLEGSSRPLNRAHETKDSASTGKPSKQDLFKLGVGDVGLSSDTLLYTHEYSDRAAVSLDGLSELMRNMAIGLDIRLGNRVHVVSWNPEIRTDSVLLRFTDVHGKLMNESFDVVIVTVPLGVLKTQSLRFQPPLPLDKANAIDGLRVGHQNKVVLLFKEPFWKVSSNSNKDTASSSIHENQNGQNGAPSDSSASQPERNSVVWQDESLGIMALDCEVGMALPSAAKVDGMPKSFKHLSALQIVWCGDTALTMNQVQPKECVDAIVEKLKQAYGSEVEAKLDGYVWSPWSADPHCYGAHSYVPYGEHPSVRLAFSEPFHCGRIGFAGEHTHLTHPSSLHGAYESGIREARRILHSFTECSTGQLAYPFNTLSMHEAITDLPWKVPDPISFSDSNIFSQLPNTSVRISPSDIAY